MPISGRAYRKQVSEDIQFFCWDIELDRATAIVSGRRSPHCSAFWLAIGSGKETSFQDEDGRSGSDSTLRQW